MDIRKALISMTLIVLLAVTGCEASTSTSGLETTTAGEPAFEFENIISATGEVRPARWASLSFPVSGRVKFVHSEEGAQVTAGDILLELDAVQLERGLAEARAALAAAEADLERIQAGAHTLDVAAA